MKQLIHIFSKVFDRKSAKSSKKVVFLHIPKTGGTTFRNILLKIYGASYCYCANPGLEHVQDAFEKFDCIELHIDRFEGEDVYIHKNVIQERNWDTFRDKNIFIMFRNPVDRVISNYFELERRRAREGRPGFSIEQFLRRKGEHNKQVGFLLGHHPSSRRFPSRSDLPFAKRALLELNMHVGIMERYADSMRIFQHVTGQQIPPGAMTIENSTQKSLLSEFDEGIREIIRKKNDLDFELYEFVRNLFEKQLLNVPSSQKVELVFEYPNQSPVEEPAVQLKSGGEDAETGPNPARKKQTVGSAKRSYLICTVPRSGSTLLAEILSSSRLAGRPEEYFLAWYRSVYKPNEILPMDHSWLIPPEDYLKRVFEEGTTNGVLGMKVMYTHFSFLIEQFRYLLKDHHSSEAALMNRIFPDLHYIYLIRENVVRQAVSWARAEQTGAFVHLHPQERNFNYPEQKMESEIRYDFRHILRLYEKIFRMRRAWESFFKRSGITPFRLTYESFANSHESAVERIMDFLGLDRPEQITVSVERAIVQGDQRNHEWSERFKNDASSAGIDLQRLSEGSYPLQIN